MRLFPAPIPLIATALAVLLASCAGGKGKGHAATPANHAPQAHSQIVPTEIDAPISVTLTATDADHDQIVYAIATGPVHGSVIVNGSEVMYSPASGFSGIDAFVFRASDGHGGTAQATITVIIGESGDSSFRETWRYGFLGNGIGAGGLVAADIDGDGVPEIIADGSTQDYFQYRPRRHWFVARKDSAGTGYSIVYYHEEGGDITALAVLPQTASRHALVLVAGSDGSIAVYDGSDHHVVQMVRTALPTITALAVGDADNDERVDVVAASGAQIQVIDGDSLVPGGVYDAVGTEVVVGDVDGTSGNEVVVSGGAVLSIRRDAAMTVWQSPTSFGTRLALGPSFDGGPHAIVGVTDANHISVYDAVIRTVAWSVESDNELLASAVAVADVTGHGDWQLLYGDGAGYIVSVGWMSHSPSVLTRLMDHEFGFSRFAVADSHTGRHAELVCGSKEGDMAFDTLVAYDLVDRHIDWTSLELDGPAEAVTIGDTNGDGRDEIIAVSHLGDGGYSSGVVLAFDAATKAPIWHSTQLPQSRVVLHDVAIGDAEGLGHPQILVAADGRIHVLDGMSKAVIHSWPVDAAFAVRIARFAADGPAKIVVGGGRNNTGDLGTFVYILDGATGRVEWTSPQLGSYWSHTNGMSVTDVTGDGVPDIVVVADNTFVIDGRTHEVHGSAGTGYVGLAIADLDHRGPRILAGRDGGAVDVLSPIDLAVERTVQVGTGTITGIATADVTGDTVPELIVTDTNLVTDASTLRIAQAANGRILWSSSRLGASLDRTGRALLAHGQGEIEILVGYGNGIFALQGSMPLAPQ